jgi:hypothetical protein
MSSRRWIVGPRFDLTWFVGGAFAGYGLFALHAVFGVDMTVVWLAWFALLDCPHFFGTWSRTYLDREEWRERGRLLGGSLLWLALPPAVLLAAFVLHRAGLARPRGAFLVLVSAVNVWAYWHVVRQHYGFLALYQRKNGDVAGADRAADALLLYVGLLAPFAAFVVRHPETRATLGLPAGPSAVADTLVMSTAAAVAAAALLFLARQAARLRRGLPLNLPKLLFLAAVVPLHLVVGYSDAVLTAPVLGFAAFVTIYHNVQYHALLWFYQRNRYGSGDGARHGAAAWIGRSFATFALSAVAVGAVVGAIVCALDVQPVCVPWLDASRLVLFGDVTWSDALLGVFLGFLMHHYFLDQFIWRPSRDTRLQRDLQLAPA